MAIQPTLPYAFRSRSFASQEAVGNFDDAAFPGDPRQRLVRTGEQLTGAHFPNGQVEAVDANFYANLMRARVISTRGTLHPYHVNLESRSGQAIKRDLGLPYEDHSRWDRMLTAMFAATTLAGGVGAPAAHAATAQQQGWAHELARAIIQKQVVSIAPTDFTVNQPSNRFAPGSLQIDASYHDMVSTLRGAAQRGKTVALLETHGGDGLGFASAEKGRSVWEIASRPRMAADMPSGIGLAVVSTCNPRAVLGQGDISPQVALAHERELGIRDRQLVVHNLHEDITLQDGRVVSRVPYRAAARSGGPVKMIAPDTIGIMNGAKSVAERGQEDVFILAGHGTTSANAHLGGSDIHPSQKMVAQAEQELARVRAEQAAGGIGTRVVSRAARTPNRGVGPINIVRGNPAIRSVALTFDDGPYAAETPKILRILKEEGVRGTFFVKGENVLAHPEIARRMAREGNLLANHTMAHERLLGLTPAQVEWEIGGGSAAIEQITGQRPRFFRSPGGRSGPREMAALQRHGLFQVLWTNDPGDFAFSARTEAGVHQAVRVVNRRVLSQLNPGGIILLHDSSKTTVPGLRSLIRSIKAKGYQFETIEQMATQRPMLATRTDTYGSVMASRLADTNETALLGAARASAPVPVSRAASPARVARDTIRRLQADAPFIPVPGTSEGLALETGLFGLLGLSRRRKRRPGEVAVTRVTPGAAPPEPVAPSIAVVPIRSSPVAQEAFVRPGPAGQEALSTPVAAARSAVRDIPQWVPPVDTRLDDLTRRAQAEEERIAAGLREGAAHYGQRRRDLSAAQAEVERLRQQRAKGQRIPTAAPSEPIAATQSIAQETAAAERTGVTAAAQVEKAAASVEREAGLHPAILGSGIAATIVGGFLIAHQILSGRTLHQRHQNLESESGKQIKRQMDLPFQAHSRIDIQEAALQAYRAFQNAPHQFLAARSHHSPAETAAASRYKGFGFTSINNALRTDPLALTAEGRETVNTLDMLTHSGVVQQDFSVHRGFSGHGLDKSRPLVGQEFSDQGFVSTSLNPYVVDEFARTKEHFTAEVRLPRGSKGFLLSSHETWKQSDKEAEFVLPRGTTFKVLEEHAAESAWAPRHLVLEAITPEHAPSPLQLGKQVAQEVRPTARGAMATAEKMAGGGTANELHTVLESGVGGFLKKLLKIPLKAHSQTDALAAAGAPNTLVDVLQSRSAGDGAAAGQTASQVTQAAEKEATLAFHGPVLAGILVVGALFAGGVALSRHHPATHSSTWNGSTPEPTHTGPQEQKTHETQTRRRGQGAPRSTANIHLHDADLDHRQVDEMFSKHFSRGYAVTSSSYATSG